MTYGYNPTCAHDLMVEFKPGSRQWLLDNGYLYQPVDKDGNPVGPCQIDVDSLISSAGGMDAGCNCFVQAGANVTVTGDGTETNPYVIAVAGGGGGIDTNATLSITNPDDGDGIIVITVTPNNGGAPYNLTLPEPSSGGSSTDTDTQLSNWTLSAAGLLSYDVLDVVGNNVIGSGSVDLAGLISSPHPNIVGSGDVTVTYDGASNTYTVDASGAAADVYVAGANVTITGSGSPGDPYVIAATGAAGLTVAEICEQLVTGENLTKLIDAIDTNTSGTVITHSGADFVTTDGITITDGDEYVEFPDGTTSGQTPTTAAVVDVAPNNPLTGNGSLADPLMVTLPAVCKGPGEVYPATALAPIDVTLADNTVVTVAPGDTLPPATDWSGVVLCNPDGSAKVLGAGSVTIEPTADGCGVTINGTVVETHADNMFGPGETLPAWMEGTVEITVLADAADPTIATTATVGAGDTLPDDTTYCHKVYVDRCSGTACPMEFKGRAFTLSTDTPPRADKYSEWIQTDTRVQFYAEPDIGWVSSNNAVGKCENGEVWDNAGTEVTIDATDPTTWPQDFGPSSLKLVTGGGSVVGVVVYDLATDTYEACPLAGGGGTADKADLAGLSTPPVKWSCFPENAGEVTNSYQFEFTLLPNQAITAMEYSLDDGQSWIPMATDQILGSTDPTAAVSGLWLRYTYTCDGAVINTPCVLVPPCCDDPQLSQPHTTNGITSICMHFSNAVPAATSDFGPEFEAGKFFTIEGAVNKNGDRTLGQDVLTLTNTSDCVRCAVITADSAYHTNRDANIYRVEVFLAKEDVIDQFASPTPGNINANSFFDFLWGQTATGTSIAPVSAYDSAILGAGGNGDVNDPTLINANDAVQVAAELRVCLQPGETCTYMNRNRISRTEDGNGSQEVRFHHWSTISFYWES